MHHRSHDWGVSVQKGVSVRGSLSGGLCLGWVSLQGDLCLGGLCPGGLCPGVSPRGFYVWGSLSRGSLSRKSLSGVSVQWGLSVCLWGGILCLGVSVRGSLSRGVSVREAIPLDRDPRMVTSGW